MATNAAVTRLPPQTATAVLPAPAMSPRSVALGGVLMSTPMTITLPLNLLLSPPRAASRTVRQIRAVYAPLQLSRDPPRGTCDLCSPRHTPNRKIIADIVR